MPKYHFASANFGISRVLPHRQHTLTWILSRNPHAFWQPWTNMKNRRKSNQKRELTFHPDATTNRCWVCEAFKTRRNQLSPQLLSSPFITPHGQTQTACGETQKGDSECGGLGIQTHLHFPRDHKRKWRPLFTITTPGLLLRHQKRVQRFPFKPIFFPGTPIERTLGPP